MEQQQAQQASAERRPRLWMVAVVSAVAAILVLSVLAFASYLQAVDYRESKYRAQYQIVNEMVTILPTENATIALMLDPDEDNGIRRAAALSGTRIAEMLAGDAFSLAVMYGEGDERRSSLFALGSAFSGVSVTLYEGYLDLSSPTHVFAAEYVSMLRDATGIMTDVLGCLRQGLLPEVDGIVDPYHVVGGIPMDSIASAAAALTSTVTR